MKTIVSAVKNFYRKRRDEHREYKYFLKKTKEMQVKEFGREKADYYCRYDNIRFMWAWLFLFWTITR